MSRISASTRQAVAKSLADTYCIHHRAPSGEVRIKSLAFSPYPRQWSIIADTSDGRFFGFGYRKCDVEITATVSRLWLENGIFDGMVYFHAGESANGSKRLLAGKQPLPPPPGIDGLELIAYSDMPPESRSTFRLTSRWAFRFYAHNHIRVCGITAEFPDNLPRAIAAAHEEFNQYLASQVARRLIPQPAASHSTPDEWAKAYMHTIRSRRIKATP